MNANSTHVGVINYKFPNVEMSIKEKEKNQYLNLKLPT